MEEHKRQAMIQAATEAAKTYTKVVCAECGEEYTAAPEYRGTNQRCAECGADLYVPVGLESNDEGQTECKRAHELEVLYRFYPDEDVNILNILADTMAVTYAEKNRIKVEDITKYDVDKAMKRAWGRLDELRNKRKDPFRAWFEFYKEMDRFGWWDRVRKHHPDWCQEHETEISGCLSTVPGFSPADNFHTCHPQSYNSQVDERRLVWAAGIGLLILFMLFFLGYYH